MKLSHQIWISPAESDQFREATASCEAELAAGDESVSIVKVGGTYCPPGTLAEDLHGAGGEPVDVHPTHQPHSPLLPCRKGGVERAQLSLRMPKGDGTEVCLSELLGSCSVEGNTGIIAQWCYRQELHCPAHKCFHRTAQWRCCHGSL